MELRGPIQRAESLKNAGVRSSIFYLLEKKCYRLHMAAKRPGHLRLVSGGDQTPTDPDHETISTILREFLRKYGDKTPISITCVAHLAQEDLSSENQTGLVATLWRSSDCSQIEHLGAVVKFSRFMDEIFDNENEENDGG